MADTVGRSIIEVGADATDLTTGMAAAAQAVENFENKAVDSANNVGKSFTQMGNETTKSGEKLDATTKRFINSLERESQAAGRTRSEYLELRAAKMGVSEQAAPMIARLREQEVAAKAAAAAAKMEADATRAAAMAKRDAATAFNQYGMSAKQTTAALRQVPAQITDIIVSLQGGQAPLNVLLQQGGQLKDVFGGVVPALRGLATGIASLINPYTVLAAAIGAVGLAYYKGSEQANEYFRAVTASGGSAGVSAAGLAQLSEQVGKISGRYSEAAEAAAALAETGSIGGNNLNIALRGVVAGTEVTKRSVKELVADFAAIAKDPVDAVVKLNEKYNFLTAEVYNNIVALKEQGRSQEAATAAMVAFADAMENRKGKIIDNAGYIERAWRAIKEEIIGAGVAFASIGAPGTDMTQLTSLRRQLASYQQSAGPGGAAPGTRIAAMIADTEQQINIIERRIGAQNRLADSEMRQKQAAKDAFAAEASISKIRDEGATKTEKLNKALADYRAKLDDIRAANPSSVELDPKNIAATEAAIRNRFKDTSRPKEYQEDAATRLLGKLREQEAALKAQLADVDKLTAAEQALAKFNQEIADIKTKKILTADQKSLLANEDKLRAQLEVNVAVQNEVVARDKATKELEKQQRLQDQLNERARQLAQTIEDSNAARQTTGQETLAVFGMGARAKEELAAQQKIQAEFRRYQEQLTKATPADLLGSDKYKEAVAGIQSGLSQALAIHRQYYADLRALEGDWNNGLKTATQNYIDNASNSSKQSEELFSGAFKGMEDALVQFVMTGKLSFDQLAGFIVASITRIIIQQQISNALGVAGTAAGGGGLGSFISTGLSALIGGGGGLSGQLASVPMAPADMDWGVMMPRAAGGPVGAGSMYEVNENMPELLNFKGRQFLMMGNESGQVSNLKEGSKLGGGRPIVVNVSAVQGMNRDTALQQGSRIGQGIKNAMGRNN